MPEGIEGEGGGLRAVDGLLVNTLKEVEMAFMVERFPKALKVKGGGRKKGAKSDECKEIGRKRMTYLCTLNKVGKVNNSRASQRNASHGTEPVGLNEWPKEVAQKEEEIAPRRLELNTPFSVLLQNVSTYKRKRLCEEEKDGGGWGIFQLKRRKIRDFLVCKTLPIICEIVSEKLSLISTVGL